MFCWVLKLFSQIWRRFWFLKANVLGTMKDVLQSFLAEPMLFFFTNVWLIYSVPSLYVVQQSDPVYAISCAIQQNPVTHSFQCNSRNYIQRKYNGRLKCFACFGLISTGNLPRFHKIVQNDWSLKLSLNFLPLDFVKSLHNTSSLLNFKQFSS